MNVTVAAAAAAQCLLSPGHGHGLDPDAHLYNMYYYPLVMR